MWDAGGDAPFLSILWGAGNQRFSACGLGGWPAAFWEENVGHMLMDTLDFCGIGGIISRVRAEKVC